MEEADEELGEELEDEGALDDVIEELEDQAEEEVAVRAVDGDHAGDVDDEVLPLSLVGVVVL